MLLNLQDNHPPSKRPPWDVEPSELDQLGITKVWPHERGTVSGRVYILSQAGAGSPVTSTTLGNGWRKSFATKMTCRGSLPIIPMSWSDTRSFGPQLPATWRCSCSSGRPADENPPLPCDGAETAGRRNTRMGCGPVYVARCAGLVPDRGWWWRTPWRWPSEGPVTLSDEESC